MAREVGPPGSRTSTPAGALRLRGRMRPAVMSMLDEEPGPEPEPEPEPEPPSARSSRSAAVRALESDRAAARASARLPPLFTLCTDLGLDREARGGRRDAIPPPPPLPIMPCNGGVCVCWRRCRKSASFDVCDGDRRSNC